MARLCPFYSNPFENVKISEALKNDALLGYRTADSGKILENIVYLHLIITGYQVRIGKFQNKEIDFVCVRGDEKIYVQVAYLITDEATREG